MTFGANEKSVFQAFCVGRSVQANHILLLKLGLVVGNSVLYALVQFFNGRIFDLIGADYVYNLVGDTPTICKRSPSGSTKMSTTYIE